MLSKSALFGYYPGPYPNPGVLPYDSRRSLAEIREHWKIFVETSRLADDILLYIHVPYCLRICSFCDSSRDEWNAQADLDRYLDNLEREMDGVADLFAGRPFRSLYVGGGTPNLLSAQQLIRLAGIVDARFVVPASVVRSIELAPELATPEKVSAVREGGFNRVSLGVQSLNREALEAVNRPTMTEEKARTAAGLVLDAGIKELNIDLIFGLPRESAESCVRGLREILTWQPTTVINQILRDSLHAQLYSARGDGARLDEEFFACAASVLAETKPPYTFQQRPLSFVLAHERLWRRWDSSLEYYSLKDRVSFSTLGFGRYSHSWLQGSLRYQNASLDPVFSPSAPCYGARALVPAAEALMDVACSLMNDGACDLDAVERRWGGLPGELLQALPQWEQDGSIRREGRRLLPGGTPDNPVLPLIAEMTGAGAAAGMQDSLSVPVAIGDDEIIIRVEPVAADSQYYSVVNGVGLYYARPHAQPAREAPQVLLALDEITAHLRATGASGDRWREAGELVRSFVQERWGAGPAHLRTLVFRLEGERQSRLRISRG